jgi:hypothetical protein
MARLDHRVAEDHRSADRSDGSWRERIGRCPSGDPVDAGLRFSGKPASTGWGPERMGRAWAELMNRLGYTRYAAQGGDWGAFVVDQMGLQAPEGLLAIHTNMPCTVPADVDKAAQAGYPPPSGRLPTRLPALRRECRGKRYGNCQFGVLRWPGRLFRLRIAGLPTGPRAVDGAMPGQDRHGWTGYTHQVAAVMVRAWGGLHLPPRPAASAPSGPR